MAPQATNPGQAEQAVLDALRHLEAALRASLGPEVLFVLVAIAPGEAGREIWRASNCPSDSLRILQAAVEHHDIADGQYFTAPLRQ